LEGSWAFRAHALDHSFYNPFYCWSFATTHQATGSMIYGFGSIEPVEVRWLFSFSWPDSLRLRGPS